MTRTALWEQGQPPTRPKSPHALGNSGGLDVRTSACGPCLLALVLLRVPAWTVSLCILWTSYMCSPSGLCATWAAMANARDVISIYLSGGLAPKYPQRAHQRPNTPHLL